MTKSKDDEDTPSINLHLFEWSENAACGREISGLKSIDELETQSNGVVRVIFAPPDVPSAGSGNGLAELFLTCGIPTAFIEETLQGVSQSFAAQEDVDGTTFIWFHLLCKTVEVMNNRIVQTKNAATSHGDKMGRHAEQHQSQSNFSWLKPGFVLKLRNQSGTRQSPKRTQTSVSESTLNAGSTQVKVELFCFGAPSTLLARLQRLKTVAPCDDILQDPYMLLDIVFEEMYRVLDWTGWTISDVFSPCEKQTLEMASQPGTATKELLQDHFTGLHNLAKHTIYLRENCEAILTTLEDLRDHHDAVIGKCPNSPQKLTRQALKYRKTLFQSTQRRLGSLDARMANIIELSFHVVTQGDSRVMQSENQSMKTIAVMTLIFMPLGTVASIFGTQFMKLQDESPFHITVSHDFWLMW